MTPSTSQALTTLRELRQRKCEELERIHARFEVAEQRFFDTLEPDVRRELGEAVREGGLGQ